MEAKRFTLPDKELCDAINEAYALHLSKPQGGVARGIIIGNWLIEHTAPNKYEMWENGSFVGWLELGVEDKLWTFTSSRDELRQFRQRLGKIVSALYQWVAENRRGTYDVLLWEMDAQYALVRAAIKENPSVLKDVPATNMSRYLNLGNRIKSFDVGLNAIGNIIEFSANYHTGETGEVWYCNGNSMIWGPEAKNLGGSLNGWRILAWAASHVMKMEVSQGK